MARSGSYDFTRTRDQIIYGAMRLCGVKDAGQTVSADELSDASEALEMMVKAWQAQGLHLWKQKEATLFVQPGTRSYTLGPSGDNATQSYVETTLSADAVATDATISVTSDDGISDADYIGIVLDGGTIQWTTVSGAPVGDAVTLADALTGDASSGNKVYAYTSKIQRPLRVLSIRRENNSGTEIELELLSRNEYFELPNKSTRGTPTQAYYDPQLDGGTLYLWVTPDDVSAVFNFTYMESIQDFDEASNEADFPAEWLEALKYNLAVRLAPEYGIDFQSRSWLKAEAEQYLNAVTMWDNEPESFFFEPDYRR